MRPELDVLLQEFERLSLDDRVFLDFVNDDELAVRVRFQKIANGRCWSIGYLASEDASRQTVSRIHFPAVLRAFGVSNTLFERELGGILLTQAAFADEFVREVSNFLGVDAVRNSILQTQQFMDSFREAFSKCTRDLAVNAGHVPDDMSDSNDLATFLPQKSVEKARPRFRVVKNS